MAHHRGFTRKKFVDAVGTEYLRKYFVDRIGLNGIDGELGETEVAELLEQQEEFARTTIDEEFQCINDVAEKGMDYLDQACSEFGQTFDVEWPRERVAMHLYLVDRAAFQTAYDWYLWRTVSNSQTHHQFVGLKGQFDAATTTRFQQSVADWYASQHKSDSCEVRPYKDDDAHVLIVAHGDYCHAHAIWKNGKVETEVFRPGKEDVLRFTPDNGVLSMKLSSRSSAQREHYIEAFGNSFLGLEEVPPEAYQNTTVSLEPIRTGQFDFCQWGKGQIEWIRLVEVEMELEDIKAQIALSSPDILATVKDDLKELKLTNGKLKAARLKYKLKYKGAPSRPIPVEVRPPHRTIFNRKRDADIIEAHLRENKVLLV